MVLKTYVTESGLVTINFSQPMVYAFIDSDTRRRLAKVKEAFEVQYLSGYTPGEKGYSLLADSFSWEIAGSNER